MLLTGHRIESDDTAELSNVNKVSLRNTGKSKAFVGGASHDYKEYG